MFVFNASQKGRKPGVRFDLTDKDRQFGIKKVIIFSETIHLYIFLQFWTLWVSTEVSDSRM